MVLNYFIDMLTCDPTVYYLFDSRTLTDGIAIKINNR